MPTAPLDDLTTALARFGELLTGLDEPEWELSTPCSDWSVRDLANHLVGGNLLFAAALRGEPLPPREELVRRSREDRLGADPAAAHRASAGALLAGFRTPGALERVVHVPVGDLPGIAAVHLRIVETLVHGWDLATATSRAPGFPDELAAAELGFSRDLLGRLPAGRRPFAASQPVADGGPALDRLVALLGRRVEVAGQIGGRSS